MIIVDTNIILRYLLNDDEELNEKATENFDKKLCKLINDNYNKF